jgi:ubiquinone/menaquinone biosynthesis C-methylase UbiE
MPAIHDARATMFGLAHNADRYERFAGHLARRLYRRVAGDVAGLPPDARILDVGTGPGLLPLRIAAIRPDLRIDAVDLAPEMIDRARHNATRAGQGTEITFSVADVAALPFPDASFDLIVSTISQHHWPDPGAGLSELRRVLRPGAQAWIYDFRWAMRRAERAARAATPPIGFTKQAPLTGTSRFNPIGRLIVDAGLP